MSIARQRLIFIAVTTLSCSPAASQTENSSLEAPAVRPTEAERALHVAERAKDIAELKSTVLEARQDLQDAAYSRLEIGMGLFALLITLLVITFGFRTEKAAARAARGELADRQKELDEIINQSRVASEAATRAATAAESASVSAGSHAKTAADHAALAKEGADRARSATINVTEGESLQIDSVALEEIRNKPRDSRTPQDYRTLILAELENDNWEDLVTLSREMQYLACGGADGYSFALFQEAYAVGQQGKSELEVTIYDKIIDMFDGHESDDMEARIAASYLNRGIARAIASGDYTKTEDFDEVISRFGKGGSDRIKEIVAEAHYQRAVAFSERNQVRASIGALRDWKSVTGKFDCDQILNSVFFKYIVHRPQFAKFMEEMGCELPTQSISNSGNE